MHFWIFAIEKRMNLLHDAAAGLVLVCPGLQCDGAGARGQCGHHGGRRPRGGLQQRRRARPRHRLLRQLQPRHRLLLLHYRPLLLLLLLHHC